MSTPARVFFVATTTTGFEYAVRHELELQDFPGLSFDESNSKCSGKVLFSLCAESKLQLSETFERLKKMLSVKRYYAFAGRVDLSSACVPAEMSKDAEIDATQKRLALQELEAAPIAVGSEWHEAVRVLRVWRETSGDTISSHPSFRVTCNRGGRHVFETDEAGKTLADGVNKLEPLWEPCLVDCDIEVVAHVHFSCVSFAISLSPGRRNRKKTECTRNEKDDARTEERGQDQKMLGITALQVDLAYGLLVAASLRPNDILVDPMCGSNAIAETALQIGVKFCIVGDYAPVAIRKTAHNAALLPKNLRSKLDIVRWDCRNLPLRDSTVDALVTDMPFGKRIGSVGKNVCLYPPVLREFLRVSRLKLGQQNGTAVLLTASANLIRRELKKLLPLGVLNRWGEEVGKGWHSQNVHSISHGGMECSVFVLKPRHAVVRQDQSSSKPHKRSEKASSANCQDVASLSRQRTPNNHLADNSQACPKLGLQRNTTSCCDCLALIVERFRELTWCWLK